MEKYLVASALLFAVVVPVHFAAAGDCGDIIFAYDEYPESREPIYDCNDPFQILTDEEPISSITLTIDGTDDVENNDTVYIADLSSKTPFSIATEPQSFKNLSSLYKHEGDDYRFIQQGATNTLNLTATGTYSLVTQVIIEDELFATETLWQSVKELFLPTVYAEMGLPFRVDFFVITFTVEQVQPQEPTGASSVLFLPGIMGSRLFEEGDFCDDLESESQLWFSVNNECKQLRLATSFLGGSNNQVYTKSGTPGILDETLTLNLYKTFLGRLADWKQDEIINDYKVVPYDWRGELDTVLKSELKNETKKIFLGQAETVVEGYLYKTLTELAENSNNGKVTVVAHSNGGLVIKQLISNLQNTNDPLLSKIDNVILLAVPQLGAPNAAIGILHGEEIEPVMSQATTRRLMNTMPFSHHLLPTSDYFNTTETPVIAFEAGEATDSWISSFGATISSRDELHQFLSKDSGRIKPELEDLETPEVVDNYLLNYAKTTEIIQSSFVPASNMKIYQIAGIGLETPSTLEYFSDRECVNRNLFFICTEYRPKVSYRIKMTIDGDGTVPLPSALVLATDSQVERRWLNLFEYNDNVFNFNRKHKDILEVPDVINFVSNTIQSTTTLSYDYLSDTVPTIDEGDRLVFQLHSPLDMSLITGNGKKVSSSTVEVSGAVYRRYGELQYISIARDENITLLLKGLAAGSFTLDIEAVKVDTVTERQTYFAIPSSVDTEVTMSVDGNSPLDKLRLIVDYDGDGVNDVFYDTEGVTEDEITYDDLFQSIDNLSLKRVPKLLLMKVAKSAEKFHTKALVKSRYVRREEASLQLLLRQINLYERLRWVSSTEKSDFEEIVNKLLNK